MGKLIKPRASSLAFKPRKRSRDITPRIHSWRSTDKAQFLGFPVYKVGMRMAGMVDDSQSPTKGMEITVPVTVLEAPKITVFGVRLYKKTYAGDLCVGDAISVTPKAAGTLGMKKETKHKDINWLQENISKVKDGFLTALAFTNTDTAGIPKKVADIVEIGIGGKSAADQLEFAKSILGKDISVKDVIEEGEYIDTISVTRGHGWQGAIKRHGIHKQRRKATGHRRHVGTLGPWTPHMVMYTTPQAGQHGFHRRTQFNNRVLAVGDDVKKANIPGGYPHYGEVKTDFVFVKGSVPGTQKRFIFIRKATRATSQARKPQIVWGY